MRGSHRGAADNSVLVLLAVVAAVIALVLYVIFDATSLESWAVTWLVLTVIFITAAPGSRASPAAGLLAGRVRGDEEKGVQHAPPVRLGEIGAEGLREHRQRGHQMG